MNNNTLIRPFISVLLAFSFLLLTSQFVYAAKPVREAPTIIDSVIVDFNGKTIMVTGSGFNSITNARLGGVTVPVVVVDDSNLELIFNSTLADIVQSSGNYSLALNNTTFSVYISSAIIDPGVIAACPCQSFWDYHGSEEPPTGFLNQTPYCTSLSSSEDQAAVMFSNEGTFWILTTEFNANAQECALVFDEPTQTLNSQQEHEACVSYLKTNYIDTFSGPDCGI